MSYTATTLLCRRDSRGLIVALARARLPGEGMPGPEWEPVRADDPDVNHFLLGVATPPMQLTLSDAGMGRVTEDLIDVLIDRGVIQFTDLPHAAQARLMARRSSRAEMNSRLRIVPDDLGDSVL